jgi:Tol biopolymer transport system component
VRRISTARTGSQKSDEYNLPATAATRIYQTDNALPQPTLPDLSTQRWSSIFSRRNAITLLMAVVALATVSWLIISRANRIGDSSPTSLKTAEIVSWTSTPGEVYSIGAFSPDARRVAYSSNESGVKSIWVKQTTTGNPVQITKDNFINDNPIWSPDGEELAFFSFRGNRPGIWRIPYLGGKPTEIKQLDQGDVKLRYWSKNNKIYYQLGRNLFALDINSRKTTQLTNFDYSKAEISQINISPDEERIIYRSVNGNGVGSLMLSPARGGSATQIAGDASDIRNIVWHPDHKRILYTLNVEGRYQIFVSPLDGRQPTQITAGDKDAFVLDVSSDGTKILYGSSKEESDLWGVNLAKSEEFVVASDISSELWPDVSPDGQTIAYQSIRNLSQGDKLHSGLILTKPLNLEGQTFELVKNGFLPQWSPDGRLLAFLRFTGETLGLFTVNPVGAVEKQLTSGGLPSIENSVLPYNRVQTSSLSWSPDSARVAYFSVRSGPRNLWAVSADGANDTQLTNNNDSNLILNCPLWSADGKQIAYTSKTDKLGADGKLTYSVWLVETGAKQSKIIFQTTSFVRLLGWSKDEKAVIIATPTGKQMTGSLEEVSLIQVSIESGAQSPIAALGSAYLDNSYLSPDRKTIAYASHQDGKDNIWLIPITGGAAKKVTANNDSRLYFSSLAWSPDGKAIYFGKQSRYSLLLMLTNFK